jgi:7-cyano-7-deazaguanine synthase
MQIENALLCSGGMDSITLAYWLLNQKEDFEPVFVNYGQHCASTELASLKENLPHSLQNQIKIIDVSDIYQNSKSRLIDEANLWEEEVTYSDMYLPYRTLMLITVGSAYSQTRGYLNLYAGFINSNHAQEIDCSKEYMEKMASMLSNYGGVNLKMPFRDLSKYQVAKIGIELQAPIGKTFSCQASSSVPCGACPNCVDRLNALKKLTIN